MADNGVAAVGRARWMRLVRPRPLVDAVTSARESWRKDTASEALPLGPSERDGSVRIEGHPEAVVRKARLYTRP